MMMDIFGVVGLLLVGVGFGVGMESLYVNFHPRSQAPQTCEIGSFLLTPQKQVLYCAQANTWTVQK